MVDQYSKDDVSESLAHARGEFADALRSGDAVAASALYAPDAQLLPPFAEPVRGRDAIRAFWQAGLDAGVCDVELHGLDVYPRDGLTYEVGRYALRLAPAEGGQVTDRGHYVLIHARQTDGSWRRAVEMFNPDAVGPLRPAVSGSEEEPSP